MSLTEKVEKARQAENPKPGDLPEETKHFGGRNS